MLFLFFSFEVFLGSVLVLFSVFFLIDMYNFELHNFNLNSRFLIPFKEISMVKYLYTLCYWLIEDCLKIHSLIS